jgi:GNAT superfamily N-acetyltransferase
MGLSFTIDPPLTDDLRDAVVDLWQTASNAGGGLGFPAGYVARQPVAAATDAAFAGVASGRDHLCVAYETADAFGSGGPRLVGAFFLCDLRFALSDHHRLLKRLMVHPDRQGRGYGLALLGQAERLARKHGVEGIRLTARGGLGLERFYTRAGYREIGRYPAALRIAPGDDRDEVHLFLALADRQE